jgi:xanthine/CO dehydrogenase XdhC/CoxF family maturation factor
LGFDEIERIDIDSFTAIVSMAHDYNKDLKVLSTFYSKNFGYFGMLGPKKRFKRMCHELFSGETLENQVYNPVGLDIGSSSPEEIALATIAEIVKHFKGATGISLKDKAGFIHERMAL